MRDNKTDQAESQIQLTNEILAKPALLSAYIDHTLLKADASMTQIEKLCAEAIQYSFKAVCVNPCRVAVASSYLNSSKVLIASVVGFPLGASASSAKAFETELAVQDGASEIDMVINIGWLKEKEFKLVSKDINAVVEAAGPHRVKVILETGLLTKEEIQSACKISEDSGAHFVKTSTGFLGRGASIEDIQIMFESISRKIEIKASGGITDLRFACDLIAAGATRVGTSSGVQLVQNLTATSSY